MVMAHAPVPYGFQPWVWIITIGGVGALLSYAWITLPRALAQGQGPTWIFLTGLGLAFWVMLLAIIPSSFIPVLRISLAPSSRWSRLGRGTCLLAATLLWPLLLFPFQPWHRNKDFDDRMAISNTQVLLDHDFDHSRLFFRSFLRVGFVAASLPVQIGAPLAVTAEKTMPEDGFRRLWTIYADAPILHPDLDPPPSVFPRMTLVAAFWISLLVPLTWLVFRLAGLTFWGAFIGALLATLAFSNSLQTHITQTFTYLVGLMMLWAYLQATRSWRGQPKTAIHPAAGIMPGIMLLIGALTMNTLAIVAAAILADFLLQGIRTPPPHRPSWIAFGLVTVIIPTLGVLLWYEGFLSGLLTEHRLFQKEIQETMALMNFAPITGAEVLRLHGILYGWVGLGLLVVLGPIAILAARNQPSWLLFAALAVFGTLILWTVPFVFRRFLMYAIPGIVGLGVLGFEEILRRWRPDRFP